MTWEDLKDEPTEDLIGYIKCKEDADYKELADAAFIAFTFRFRVQVIDKARKIGKYWDFDVETSDMLAERVFKRFYHYPFGFKKCKCGTLEIDECVKLYLFRIAQRCFCDYNKDISQLNDNPFDGSEHVIVEFPDLESLGLPEDVEEDLRSIQKSMAAALSTLTPKHKIIYLTYKAYEKKGFKLPRPLLKQLRETTNLKQNSIRVYKNEAFQKVEEFSKENGEK